MQERAAEERQAKLEHIRKQVSSGALVIRQMTRAERAKWDRQHAILDANFTAAERTRRDSVLRNRRQRAARLSRTRAIGRTGGVDWLYWPCWPEPRPKAHRPPTRSTAREARSLGEQSSDLAGPERWWASRASSAAPASSSRVSLPQRFSTVESCKRDDPRGHCQCRCAVGRAHSYGRGDGERSPSDEHRSQGDDRAR